MQAENADSAELNRFRLRLRVAPRMRSSGGRTHVYIIIYTILGEALWGERELPRFMFVCMFYMLLIYLQHFSYQDYTKG